VLDGEWRTGNLAANAIISHRRGKVEHEAPETASVSRGQHAIHIVPADWDAAPGPLARLLDRAPAEADEVQAVVLVADADAAVGVADALIRARGGVPPRIVAATGAARAARILRAGAAPVIVGAPAQIVALVRSAVLKLTQVRALGVAWADEILAAGGGPDMEAIMAEVPKDAPRTILTAQLNPAVEDFLERYVRRAPRFGTPVAPAAGAATGGAAPSPSPATPQAPPPAVAVNYVLVTPPARATVLRRLLDETDPPSAAIFVRTDDSERAVRESLLLLGYHGNDGALRVVRGAVADHTALIVLYDLPHDPAELALATGGAPGRTIVMLLPRQLAHLHALTSGPIQPFVFAGPAETARGHDESMRSAIRREIAAGALTREVLALEPLLAETDGISIAAAALRLLERHRQSATLAAAEAAANRAPPRVEPETRPAGRPDGGGFGRPRSGGSGGRPGGRPGGGRPGGRGDARGGSSRGGPPGRGRPGADPRDRGRERDGGESTGRERDPGRSDTRPLPRSPQ
jgi:ATP-dependent RNA helicase DeaD